MTTTENSEAIKEFTQSYRDLAGIRDAISVWEALLELETKHFLGALLEEITKLTKLQEYIVLNVLKTLNGIPDGPVEIKLSQEGTSGPFVHRYKSRPNTTIKFNLVIPPDDESKKRYTIAVRNQSPS